jgi:hypothetical protein
VSNFSGNFVIYIFVHIEMGTSSNCMQCDACSPSFGGKECITWDNLHLHYNEMLRHT